MHHPVRRLAAAACASALLIGAAACTSDDDKKKSDDDKGDKKTTGVISPQLKKIPKLSDSKGIIKDTKMSDCTPKSGKVSAKGTVKNSGKSPADLVVVVSWTTSKSDVVGRGITVVKDADPGSSHDWKVSTKVDYDGKTQCVLTASRGTLG